jgi:POT family proton-dependent oligopeptide transporter
VKKWMHLDTLRDRDDSVAGAGELAEPQAAGTHPEPKGA